MTQNIHPGSASLEDLRQELRLAGSNAKRVPLLLELGQRAFGLDNRLALNSAREVLMLAGGNAAREMALKARLIVAGCLFYQGRFAEALDHSRELCSMAKKQRAAAQGCDALRLQALCLCALQRHQEAETVMHDLIRSLQSGKDRAALARALKDYGQLLRCRGAYRDSLESLLRALRICEEENYATLRAAVLGNIGAIYELIRNGAQALHYFRQCLEHYKAIGNATGVSDSEFSIGNIYFDREEFGAALDCYGRALRRIQRSRLHERELRIRLNTAVALAATAQARLAMRHLRAVLRISGKHAPALEEQARAARAKVYVLLGRDDDALSYVHEALAGSRRIEDREMESEMLSLLVEISERRRDFHAAFMYLRQQQRLKEQVKGAAVQAQIQALAASAASDASEREVDTLRRNSVEAKAKIHSQQQQLVKMSLTLQQQQSLLELLRRRIIDVGAATPARSRRLATAMAKEIETLQRDPLDINTFDERFSQVHQDFLRLLLQACPSLTTSERKICCLLRLELSSQEIAKLLFTSIHTVNTQRQHIRRKLGLARSLNLVSFLIALDDR